MKKRTYSFYVEAHVVEAFIENFNNSEAGENKSFSDNMRRAMQNAVNFRKNHKEKSTYSESEKKVLQKLKELQAFRLKKNKTKQTSLYAFFKELMQKIKNETFFSFPKNFIENL